MQDAIVLGTGNSRYLKSVSGFMSLYPTYEDFAAALVAGGADCKSSHNRTHSPPQRR